MNARLGPPKAIPATAQKLARLIDTLLQHGTAYGRQTLAADEQPSRDRRGQSLRRRAKALGYALGETPARTLR
jgi:hypothetical protein